MMDRRDVHDRETAGEFALKVACAVIGVGLGIAAADYLPAWALLPLLVVVVAALWRWR